jgi:hypothetical protein
MPKEPIPQLPRGCLEADPFCLGVSSHIVAVASEFQVELTSECGNEPLIRLRLHPSQLVIEMYDGKGNPKLATQLN